MTKLGLFAVHKIVSEYAENISSYGEKPKKNLAVFSKYAKRQKNWAYLGEFVLTKPKIF